MKTRSNGNGDVHEAMAAVSDHGSPTGALQRVAIFLTMTSHGQQNALQNAD